MRYLVLVCLAIATTGCATNGYKQFYTAAPDVGSILSRRQAPAPSSPAVDHVAGTFRSVIEQYAKKGYVAIGHSSFNSGANEPDGGAISQAVAVGADRVAILHPSYTNSVTTTIPMTTPTTDTSYTSGTATAYGSGGSATAYGNATTTTYGSKTTYVPVTTNRYDFGAMYFVKTKFVFGAFFDDLSDVDRVTFETNKGVRVLTIVDHSPAYLADVLVGDVLLLANGQSIQGRAWFTDFLAARSGGTIELTVARGGQLLNKKVTLGAF